MYSGMTHQEYVRYINRPFEGIDDMIARGCWAPKQSGYRPYQNKAEAEAALTGRDIIYRGSTGFRVSITDVTDTEVTVIAHTSDGDYTKNESFNDLFEWCKFRDNNYPCGLMIDKGNN